MKKSKQTKRKRKKQGKSSIWLYLFVLLVAFAASAGSSYFYLQERIVFKSSVIADSKSKAARKSRKKLNEGPGRLYEERDSEFMAEEGDRLFRKDASLVIVEDIIRKRFKRYDTRLLDLYFDKRGTIYIDLSNEIMKRFSGDVKEELYIIAGLYKGIKSELPGLKAMKILIEGRETESIGGHIDISRPIGGEIVQYI